MECNSIGLGLANDIDVSWEQPLMTLDRSTFTCRDQTLILQDVQSLDSFGSFTCEYSRPVQNIMENFNQLSVFGK